MKVTKTNSKGIDLIKKYEGLKLVAYLCPANVWTIGYGTTRYPNGQRVKQGDKCTELQAEEYLKHDLIQFELSVDALCTDRLNANQFSALVSFAYNLGATNLRNSTLLKKVNADVNDATISSEFLKWNRASGRVLKGLTLRRQDEARLYFE
jgi:lysozyme